jgi:hypothetical protein
MIYTHEHFIKALAERHPEIEEKSLELIVRRGLQSINKIMKDSQELILSNFVNEDGGVDYIKFFIYMTPEKQHKHALRNYYRKLRKKEQDGTSTDDNK